jgi:predicted solute-binding protein
MEALIKCLSREMATIKEIIVAARTITNSLFQISSNKILEKEKPSNLNDDIKSLRTEIAKSSLSAPCRHELLLLNNTDLCVLAQKLITSILAQEIKNPLN